MRMGKEERGEEPEAPRECKAMRMRKNTDTGDGVCETRGDAYPTRAHNPLRLIRTRSRVTRRKRRRETPCSVHTKRGPHVSDSRCSGPMDRFVQRVECKLEGSEPGVRHSSSCEQPTEHHHKRARSGRKRLRIIQIQPMRSDGSSSQPQPQSPAPDAGANSKTPDPYAVAHTHTIRRAQLVVKRPAPGMGECKEATDSVREVHVTCPQATTPFRISSNPQHLQHPLMVAPTKQETEDNNQSSAVDRRWRQARAKIAALTDVEPRRKLGKGSPEVSSETTSHLTKGLFRRGRDLALLTDCDIVIMVTPNPARTPQTMCSIHNTTACECNMDPSRSRLCNVFFHGNLSAQFIRLQNVIRNRYEDDPTGITDSKKYATKDMPIDRLWSAKVFNIYGGDQFIRYGGAEPMKEYQPRLYTRNGKQYVIPVSYKGLRTPNQLLPRDAINLAHYYDCFIKRIQRMLAETFELHVSVDTVREMHRRSLGKNCVEFAEGRYMRNDLVIPTSRRVLQDLVTKHKDDFSHDQLCSLLCDIEHDDWARAANETLSAPSSADPEAAALQSCVYASEISRVIDEFLVDCNVESLDAMYRESMHAHPPGRKREGARRMEECAHVGDSSGEDGGYELAIDGGSGGADHHNMEDQCMDVCQESTSDSHTEQPDGRSERQTLATSVRAPLPKECIGDIVPDQVNVFVEGGRLYRFNMNIDKEPAIDDNNTEETAARFEQLTSLLGDSLTEAQRKLSRIREAEDEPNEETVHKFMNAAASFLDGIEDGCHALAKQRL